MAGHLHTFGWLWLGLLAGFLYGGRIQEGWYCCFVLSETLHSTEAFCLSRPDITGLPLTNLPNWITHCFKAVDVSFCPQSP